MTCYQWAVIGAGPAGIAAVGKLLDDGIKADDILWLDPHFKVGDFGRLWRNVASNTKAKLFTRFLESNQSFNYQAQHFSLNERDPEQTCLLSHMAEPLQTISDQLKETVNSNQDWVKSLKLTQRRWHITTENNQYQANKVIIANGAVPKLLNLPETPTLSLDIAMDKQRLSQAIDDNDTIAVFGSSHSAILILKSLVELGANKIINFYRSPNVYALDMGDYILHDNTGLKGSAASWARENIDGTLPENLIRHHCNQDTMAKYLPECTKAIHAIGFSKRNNIVLENYENTDYNPCNGIIAPGLFGYGIAYPERVLDNSGTHDYRVGLWKFMDYLNRRLPLWHQYGV